MPQPAKRMTFVGTNASVVVRSSGCLSGRALADRITSLVPSDQATAHNAQRAEAAVTIQAEFRGHRVRRRRFMLGGGKRRPGSAKTSLGGKTSAYMLCRPRTRYAEEAAEARRKRARQRRASTWTGSPPVLYAKPSTLRRQRRLEAGNGGACGRRADVSPRHDAPASGEAGAARGALSEARREGYGGGGGGHPRDRAPHAGVGGGDQRAFRGKLGRLQAGIVRDEGHLPRADRRGVLPARRRGGRRHRAGPG